MGADTKVAAPPPYGLIGLWTDWLVDRLERAESMKKLKLGMSEKDRRPRFGLRRFFGCTRGAAALEFALVATPFLLLIVAILETTMVFFVSSNLEGATSEVSRLIRTGQVQAAGLTQAQYRQLICDELVTAPDCVNNLRIDVRTFVNFNNVNFSNPLTVAGDLRNDFLFQPGAPGDIVLVRAFLAWNIVTPTNFALSNMSNQQRLIASSMAFRNEPF